MVFTTDLFSAGDAINLQLTSRSLSDLNSASTLLKERLSRYPGVIDIKDSFAVGKEEISIKPLQSAANYGISMIDIASQVRQAFYV